MGVLTWLLCLVFCWLQAAKADELLEFLKQLKGKNKAEICTALSGQKPSLKDEQHVFKFGEKALSLQLIELGDDETLALIRCLVDMHIPVNVSEEQSDETLLFPAVMKKRTKTLGHLVALGVPVDQRTFADHSSPAERAIISGCRECLKRLFEGGPSNQLDPNDQNPQGCTADSEKSGDCREGWALAHFAAKEDDAPALKFLEGKGADLNQKNAENFAPVQVAVRYTSISVLTALGELRASFDVVTTKGETLAHLACEFPGSDPESSKVKTCLEIIKENGGRLSATNGQRQTPAHVCSSAKNADQIINLQALKFLFENARPSFDERDSRQRTPKMVALEEHNIAQIFYANMEAQKNARLAQREKDLAVEARHEAEASKKAIFDRAEKEQTLRKKCEDLSRHVAQLMDCNLEESDHFENISVPEGNMIPNRRWCTDGKGPCAMRCPNFDACPKVRESTLNQCAESYDADSPGCSRCADGYGRQRQDPFRCNKCGPRWRGWLTYVAKPLGIYAVSLWTAQKVEKKYLSSLLKIWLAFGVVLSSISPIIGSTQTVKFLMDAVKTGEDAASIGSPMSGGSYDCLLDINRSSSISAWFGLAVAPACVLWCLSVVALVLLWFVNAGTMRLDSTDVEGLMKDSLKISIVVMNCFLPDLAAALVRYFPCVHFQTDDNLPVKPRFLQFDVETNCDDVLPMRVTTLGLAFFICFLGPAYWIRVIHKSKEWTNRKAILGFLISGYRPKVTWWETTVLFRKCSVAAAIAMFSSSYAPMLYLSSLLFIVGIGLACHAYIQPYEDPFLNRVEFGTLLASFVAVFCTFLLQLESHSWATDKAVTIPALLTLSIAVVVPFVRLIILYCYEIRLQDLRVTYDKVRSVLQQVASLLARICARQRTAEVELIPLR